MMEVVSGDNWSYKSCKAPVKSSPLTNQHPVFYRPDVLPVTQPTVSEDWREEQPAHSTTVSDYTLRQWFPNTQQSRFRTACI